MWKDPNNPQWMSNINFPEGTIIFKLLYTNAMNCELAIFKGSPSWEAVCHPYPSALYHAKHINR
jgi:hypothetical protein